MPGILLALGLAVSPGITIEALVACTNIEDDGARLACYDLQFGRQPSPVTAPAAAAAAPAVQAGARSEDNFGLTAEQRDSRASGSRKNKQVERIVAQVLSAQMTASGRLLLTLDNGQQWLQVEPSPRQYFFKGDPITIKKASLGSFLASGPKSGTGIRIRRVE